MLDTCPGTVSEASESADIYFSSQGQSFAEPLHQQQQDGEVEKGINVLPPAVTQTWGKWHDPAPSVGLISQQKYLTEEFVHRIHRTRHQSNCRVSAWLLLACAASLLLLVLIFLLGPAFTNLMSGTSINFHYSLHPRSIRGEPPPTGVLSYLELFPKRVLELTGHRQLLSPSPVTASSSSSIGAPSSSSGGSTSPGGYKGAQLVIAGKMTVEDAPCNIAQFNFKTQEWSLTERIQLSLYNSYSGGEVYSLLANHTNQPENDSISGSSSNR